MIKLIAIDLDGTLVKEDQTVSQENISALRQAHQQGIQIVICTGRPIKSSQAVIDQLNLKGAEDYVITFNGGQILRAANNEVIYESGLDYQDFNLWYQTTQELNLPLNVIDAQWVYEPQAYPQAGPSIYVSDITTAPSKVVDFQEFDDSNHFLKFVSGTDANYLQAQFPHIDPQLLEDYNVVFSRDCLLEIMKKGTSKADALKVLGQRLGIQPEEMMTIGDQGNDMTMIEMAGIGVAMGNATQAVKDMADYVTDTNENDGVAKAIRHYILQGKED